MSASNTTWFASSVPAKISSLLVVNGRSMMTVGHRCWIRGSTACRSVGLIDFGCDMLTARVGTLPVQSTNAATCSRCRSWADWLTSPKKSPPRWAPSAARTGWFMPSVSIMATGFSDTALTSLAISAAVGVVRIRSSTAATETIRALSVSYGGIRPACARPSDQYNRRIKWGVNRNDTSYPPLCSNMGLQ